MRDRTFLTHKPQTSIFKLGKLSCFFNVYNFSNDFVCNFKQGKERLTRVMYSNSIKYFDPTIFMNHFSIRIMACPLSLFITGCN